MAEPSASGAPRDVWRAVGSPAGTVLFDMLGGRVADAIGVSDPDVHLVDGRWVMFLGAFTTRFRTELVQAALPPGDPLDSDRWELVRDPDRPRRAARLVEPSGRGAWDSAGLHSPSYARGPDGSGVEVERVYYAGRGSRRITGAGSRYAIGALQRTGGVWRRLPGPLVSGEAVRPSALEPMVRHADGRWRMWYLSAIGEVGRGEQPDYELRYTDSTDGVTGWSPPTVVSSRAEGMFDVVVDQVGDHWEMVLARGTNLYGTEPFPGQGLWWARSERPSGCRADWSPRLVRLLDTDVDPEPWFARGVLGASVHWGTGPDRDTLHVFGTGTRAAPPWWRLAAQHLRRGRVPPFPAPYYLATGRLSFPAARAHLDAGR